MTALLLLLAPALPMAVVRLRAAFRNPARLTFLDRPIPRMLRARLSSSQRPEGPAPATPRPGAGLPARILARLMPATGCHAAPLPVKLATTSTIPVVRTEDRPPWTTQPFPEVTP